MNNEDLPTVGNQLELQLLARQEPATRVLIQQTNGRRVGPYHAQCAVKSGFAKLYLRSNGGGDGADVISDGECRYCNTNMLDIEVDPNE